MTTDAADPQVPHIGANDIELRAGYQVGEYEIQAKIGEGGFGTVFKAVHPLIGKIAAVKVLSRQYSAQPEMVSRFVAEARAVNQIRHRHIIDIFSFGTLDDGRHYYVMEYLDGMPLEDYIASRGRLSLMEAIPILRAIARALDAAHAKGIAHRDLKPDNVFLVMSEDGTVEPKLLDFGIAKLLSDSKPQAHKTRTGAPMGTPHYMSPEQCRGKDVDHRTDLYAFGVMTYKMLAGQLPFDGDDYMDILLKQISAEAAPLSSAVAELSAEVDEAVAWMMKKDPAERPPNLVTAVRALEDAARAAGIQVPLAPAPSGVYAALTSPQNALATPARMSRLPSEQDSLGMAGTLDAQELSEAATLDGTAVDNGGAEPRSAAPSVAPSVAPGSQPDARSRTTKMALIAAAVVAAVVVGVAVNAMLSRDADPGPQAADPAAPADPAATGATGATGATVDGQGGQGPAATPVEVAPVDTTPVEVAPPRRLVTIDIAGPPEGTEVYGPSGLLGAVPGKIQLPHGSEPLLLTFKAKKYRTRTEQVVPADDMTLTVELERERRKTSTGSRNRDDKNDQKNSRDTIENPFDN